MNEKIYCPNPDCPNHLSPPIEKEWYRKKGFSLTKREGKIQRYQCRKCLRTFSLTYFTLNHYVHKKIPPEQLLNHLVSGSGIRDMSRAMNCNPKVIIHRIQRLSRKVSAVCSREIARLELTESVAADGLENFILSQFFPTNVNVLVGQDSQFIYNFNAYHFKRKGRCTEQQKKKKEILYKTAQFEKGAASKRFCEILDFLAKKVEGASKKTFILDTDECPIYRYQFDKHPSISKKVSHRKTNSCKERNYQNKLFPCNYIDRQIRKDLAEYIRETVQFGRNINNSMDRFTCYSFWHNFLKPYRINKTKSSYVFHGQAAGFSLEEVREIVAEVFYGFREREDVARGHLTNFQQAHWDQCLVNPMKRAAV